MPERIGRLLNLVQFLIGLGNGLAATLRQQRVTLVQLTWQADRLTRTGAMARAPARAGPVQYPA